MIFSVSVILILTVGIFAFVLGFKLTELDKLSKFVDVVFKAMAILLGMIWTLNRYYVGRTDKIRSRVESDVRIVRYPESGSQETNLALLIFRLDVVNIGAVLIDKFDVRLEIESATPSDEGTDYDDLGSWPEYGLRPAGPIEPSGWWALNDAISIPAATRAVRLRLVAIFPQDEDESKDFDWHKTFDVSEGVDQ